jgi:glucose/mannose transport system substrate-binding protein
LKAAGVVPLAMGDAGLWTTAELFENTLLGVLRPQGWQELFGGQMMFDDPRVKQAPGFTVGCWTTRTRTTRP